MPRPLRSTDPSHVAGYKLIARLGEGGQGVVYLATDAAGAHVALKVLRAELLEDERAYRRFSRELEAARRVDSKYTARIIDAGGAGDVAYIASEYIKGSSLQNSVRLWGPWQDDRLFQLAVAMASALVAFRKAGVVHRDFKPSNVLLGATGPRVIDFGIAHLVDTVGSSNSQMLGTPPYMAPEQFSRDRLGSKVDVFGWGCTVAFAANGVAPFGSGHVPAVIHRILYQEPDLGRLTGLLRDMVAACLDKEPRRRPAAHQLLARLKGDEAAWVPPEARLEGEPAAGTVSGSESAVTWTTGGSVVGSSMGGGSAPEPAPAELDVARPNVARIYDYFLGGKDNFAADRDAAERILALIPEASSGARLNRQFLGRAVRFLAHAGIRQFIDLGAGLPTRANVHEVAHQVDPAARVVYVDNDPVIRVHAQALLHNIDTATVIEADLRDPDSILDHPDLRAFIDFSEPVAVLMVGVLHFIADTADPCGIVARFRDVMAPGSYLAVSHATAEPRPQERSAVAAVYRQASAPLNPRAQSEVWRFFTGFELVDPGVVYAPQWRPEATAGDVPDPATTHMLVGVGHKP
jgi:serine/threonine protein kinase/O-methyltransferase involved in polyketide biosynthesis